MYKHATPRNTPVLHRRRLHQLQVSPPVVGCPLLAVRRGLPGDAVGEVASREKGQVVSTKVYKLDLAPDDLIAFQAIKDHLEAGKGGYAKATNAAVVRYAVHCQADVLGAEQHAATPVSQEMKQRYKLLAVAVNQRTHGQQLRKQGQKPVERTKLHVTLDEALQRECERIVKGYGLSIDHDGHFCIVEAVRFALRNIAMVEKLGSVGMASDM